jgi:hypothetical protein
VVRRAYQKLIQKKDLSATERAALKRHEKEKEERLRWQYYRSIPQKHWREMSGRQTKVINEQAARYGLPFGGARVDLPGVVRALHDFLAENAVKLGRDEDALMSGAASPALERYREERAAIARLERLEREGVLLPREPLRIALARVASIIRGAGETLQRQFGTEAQEILCEAIDDAEALVAKALDGGQNDGLEAADLAAEDTDAGDVADPK